MQAIKKAQVGFLFSGENYLYDQESEREKERDGEREGGLLNSRAHWVLDLSPAVSQQ